VETGGRPVDLPVPGVVRVIVDGGDTEKIKAVVDDTRAAGVYVQILRPRFVLMDVRVLLQLQDGTQLSDVEEAIEDGIEEYVGSVTTGETVIFGRLVSVALGTRGVTDVKSLSVDCYRDGQPSGSSSRENMALNP